MKYLNTANSTEEILWEAPAENTENLKLAVSPKGTYVYLLHSGKLKIFDIVSREEADTIDQINSAVWIGNANLIYSTKDKTSLYSTKTKKSSEITDLGPVTDLSFAPKDGGTLAFTKVGTATAVSCKTGKSLGSKENAEIRALTSEKTAIMEKSGFFGYWKFKEADWLVSLYNGPITNFTTVWEIY